MSQMFPSLVTLGTFDVMYVAYVITDVFTWLEWPDFVSFHIKTIPVSQSALMTQTTSSSAKQWIINKHIVFCLLLQYKGQGLGNMQNELLKMREFFW